MVSKIVCTIVTDEYIDRAVAIGRSLREAGSDLNVMAAVIGGRCHDISIENVRTFNVAALASATQQASSICQSYADDSDRLRWSLKSSLLQYMLQVLGYNAALYVDPDCCFFRPPKELFDTLLEGGVVLTPHWRPLSPIKSTLSFRLNFLDGLYNAGCVGANLNGVQALRWWGDACLSSCRKSHADGLHDDQRYLDLLPIYFEQTRILRHRGYNLAEWNLDLRTASPGGVRSVPDRWPINLVHFTDGTEELIRAGGDPVLEPYFRKYKNILEDSGRTVKDRCRTLSILSQEPRLRVAHVSPAHTFPEEPPGRHDVSLITLALSAAELSLPFRLSQEVILIDKAETGFCERSIPVTVVESSNATSVSAAPLSQLWELLRNIDVIHVHQAGTILSLYCIATASSLRKPLIISSLEGECADLLLAYGGLQLASGLLSISPNAEAISEAHFSGPRLAVMEPIDTVAFSPPPGPSPVSRREALCVGGCLRHAEVSRIVDSLPPDLTLNILGQVKEHEHSSFLMRDMAGKQIVVSSELDFETILFYYRRSGLFIHTSVDAPDALCLQPITLSPLEALATGVVVAVNGNVAIPELPNDERFIRIYKSSDALRQILEEFHTGRWPPPEGPALARQYVIDHHSYTAIGIRIANFYRSILSIGLISS